MDLILWRHAEAFDASQGQADLERALTARGERQAARMAEWLDRRLPAGARVLVSPALRAQQTARALERRFKTVPALAPGESAAMLLAAARWPQADKPVLVVGHQPALGVCAALLLAGIEQPWAVRKGAVWWLRRRERDGLEHVVLHAMQTPQLL